MQWRLAASESAASVSKSYDPSDGWAKNDLLQTVQVSWTNDTPTTQWVYGMVSKSGSQVTLQCRSRGYLDTRHGYQIDGDPDDVVTSGVSKFGVGSDLGNGGLLALGGAYGISEIRQHSMTAPFMPHITGWFPVAAGATFHARIEVWFVSEFWENTQIDGGDADTESKVITGDIQLDLFAIPAAVTPPPRSTPSLAGGAGNITHAVGFNNIVSGTQTEVDVPAGLTAGDILIAVVANQFGLGGDINPVQSGWVLLHSRNDDPSGWEDVHMKIWVRPIVGGEPATYSFTNGLFAEETVLLVGVRDAAPYEPDIESWYVASSLSRWRIVEDHIAPSINRAGQLLLAVSYVATSFVESALEGPLTQTPPDGMTEAVDLSNSNSALALAYMVDPPRPTGDRAFALNYVPYFTGHSICAAILIPGAQPGV
ncbi:hypothetical protein B1R94_02385 [Mycolicibacterium litorale]|nr:hypothetical protein B1R94_02385 [Mycolicibacterium litorale]